MSFEDRAIETVNENFEDRIPEYVLMVAGDTEVCSTALQWKDEDTDANANHVLNGIVTFVDDLDEEMAKDDDIERGEIVESVLQALADDIMEKSLEDI